MRMAYVLIVRYDLALRIICMVLVILEVAGRNQPEQGSQCTELSPQDTNGGLVERRADQCQACQSRIL